ARVPFPAGGKTAVTVSGTLPGSWTISLSEIAEVDGELRVRVSLAE
ncbi:MAG: hypothetical protein IIB14_08190, partial [Chloroflexi bacterium]|nr:hypothetical protein [Chloroflexota bacterium]